MRIAFDIDDTLYKLIEDTEPRIEGIGAVCPCGVLLRQKLDHKMADLLYHLSQRYDVFVWSAGGVEYARSWVSKFIPHIVVEVIPKEKGHNIDICFDDQDVDLATINMRVKREHADHHGG